LRGFHTVRNTPPPPDTDEVARGFVVRGWIPREPVAFARSRKAKTKIPEVSEIIGGWNPARDVRAEVLALVERHEHDPVSVQITRTLRFIGYGESDIGAFLRRYFGPAALGTLAKTNKVPVAPPAPDADARYDPLEKIIETLAMQLHSLRSGNRTLTDYEAMIADAGRRLAENREIVAAYAGGDAPASKTGEPPNHEALREAVVAFLHRDPQSTDTDLIDALNDLVDQDEEENPASDGEEEMSHSDEARDLYRNE
jgi:hypothetical protein